MWLSLSDRLEPNAVINAGRIDLGSFASEEFDFDERSRRAAAQVKTNADLVGKSTYTLGTAVGWSLNETKTAADAPEGIASLRIPDIVQKDRNVSVVISSVIVDRHFESRIVLVRISDVADFALKSDSVELLSIVAGRRDYRIVKA